MFIGGLRKNFTLFLLVFNMLMTAKNANTDLPLLGLLTSPSIVSAMSF